MFMSQNVPLNKQLRLMKLPLRATNRTFKFWMERTQIIELMYTTPYESSNSKSDSGKRLD